MPPTPAPSPAPVDVLVHSSPAEWWQIVAALAPVAVLIAAAVGAFMAWRTLRQKAVADDRAEWWKRTQWALDRALDQDPDIKALGLAALGVLARSELARNEELELLDIAWKSVNGVEENAGSWQPARPAAFAASVESGDNLGNNEGTDSRRERGRQAMSTDASGQKNGPVPRHITVKDSNSTIASQHRVQVAAARLRVTLDERLGRPTPAQTKALAKEEL
ncbi:hypothetical protein ACFVTM_11025 [Arthrobacter sp. NPDC058130]|uniref:hypothetical protein n=1 Tax=Arthrobacter sp. NPDC058130 TaxID=3346353 RepID=UPI0036EB83F7